MTRRRVLFGLLLASAVLTCFAGWLWIASRPRVSLARFEQVKQGMTREEVIRTVGGSPGDYTMEGTVPDKGQFSNLEYRRCDEGLRVTGDPSLCGIAVVEGRTRCEASRKSTKISFR
jgi:hypothetical protein